MDLGKRTVQEGSMPMPAELVSLIQRMQSTALLKDFQPNEANAIDYCKSKGHWLKAHVDDRCVSSGDFLHNTCASLPAADLHGWPVAVCRRTHANVTMLVSCC